MSDDQPVALNREQRRRQKFRRAQDASQDNRRPQSENNPAFSQQAQEPDMADGPKEAVAESGTQGETKLTGPGTGGAVESDNRLPLHEGMHVGRRATGKKQA